MTNLKTLVSEYEKQRRARERYQMAVALIAGVCVLGGLTLAAFRMQEPKETPPVAKAPTPSAFDTVELSAKAAIVLDLTTGEVLYAKNAEAQLPLASLTKLLTLYAASQTLSENTVITMSADALAADGDTGFTQGERFTFRELARMAITASSNDAAAAIAEAAADAGHASNGTALLANVASALGLTQTYALNGTGLDENGTISGAYGSARDIAVLAGELLKRAPGIARASIDPTITANSLAGRSYTLTNTNPGVDHIPGLLLSKTGYTDLAGGNLAIVFDAGIEHPVAIVVLGSTRDERFVDVNELVAATTAEFAGLTLP
ncbi:MAG TPA: serine hydrolase [Candidatus Paceibacterota bacterium]|nr:serine hydrolase [Candidatus Paceibacterota bacterium]